jgi:hypothetical protein
MIAVAFMILDKMRADQLLRSYAGAANLDKGSRIYTS